MIEIEIKARARDLLKTADRVKELHATFVGNDIQEDLYFNAPHRNFLETGEVLRLRKTQNGHVLTYKKKKSDKTARVRLEREVNIEPEDELTKILMDLGFNQIARIKKERQIYSLEGCDVTLDKVKGLGNFIEVEMKIPEGGDKTKSKRSIRELLEKMGIQKSDIENKTYLELLLAGGKK